MQFSSVLSLISIRKSNFNQRCYIIPPFKRQPEDFSSGKKVAQIIRLLCNSLHKTENPFPFICIPDKIKLFL